MLIFPREYGTRWRGWRGGFIDLEILGVIDTKIMDKLSAKDSPRLRMGMD